MNRDSAQRRTSWIETPSDERREVRLAPGVKRREWAIPELKEELGPVAEAAPGWLAGRLDELQNQQPGLAKTIFSGARGHMIRARWAADPGTPGAFPALPIGWSRLADAHGALVSPNELYIRLCASASRDDREARGWPAVSYAGLGLYAEGRMFTGTVHLEYDLVQRDDRATLASLCMVARAGMGVATSDELHVWRMELVENLTLIPQPALLAPPAPVVRLKSRATEATPSGAVDPQG